MSLSVERVLARYTARQVLARRRALALLGLVLIPVLLSLAFSGQGEEGPVPFLAQLFTVVVVPVILPLVALVIGTGAFGAEVEDGTAVFVLARPVARWRIVLVRLLVAGTLTALLVAPATLVAGLVGAHGSEEARSLAVGFALGVAAGSFLYCAVFLALSLVTRRALIVGFGYVIVWEGMLSGLFSGTRILSVRQYTLSLADSFSGAGSQAFTADLAAGTAAVMSVVVLVLATVYAIRRLRIFEVGEAV